MPVSLHPCTSHYVLYSLCTFFNLIDMDGKELAIRSLGSLSSLLDSQISETVSQIESITLSTKSLVPSTECDKLLKEQAKFTPSGIDEDVLITELYKSRLELLMDVQKQEFIGDKIQGMINESEELVRSIIEYYESAEESRKMELEASRKRFEHYKIDVLGSKTELLKLNTSSLEESYQKAAENAHEALTAAREGHDKILSPKYKESLDELIDALNISFHSSTNID